MLSSVTIPLAIIWASDNTSDPVSASGPGSRVLVFVTRVTLVT